MLNISPNSSGINAEFEFTLTELSPNTRTPNDAIVNTKPILQQRTAQPFLLYDLNYPTLQPGKTYVWRVRAVDISGRDLFVNSGYSETWLFVYGNSCAAPGNLAAEVLSTSTARISYRLDPWQTGFNLRYRLKTLANNAAWESKSNTNLDNKFTLDKLKEDTEYEYQLQSNCNSQLSDWTDSKTFKTFAKETKGFVCGAVPPGVDLKNINLIPELKKGDTLLAADMEYILTSVKKNADGTFSGTASGEYAVFNNVTFNHDFDKIKVNTDRRMFEGVIFATDAEIEVLDEATRNDIVKNLGPAGMEVLKLIEDGLRNPEELEKKVGDWVNSYDGDDKEAIKAQYATLKSELLEAVKELKEAKAAGDRAAKKAAKKKIRDSILKGYVPVIGKMIWGTVKKLVNDIGTVVREVVEELRNLGGKRKDSIAKALPEKIRIHQSLRPKILEQHNSEYDVSNPSTDGFVLVEQTSVENPPPFKAKIKMASFIDTEEARKFDLSVEEIEQALKKFELAEKLIEYLAALSQPGKFETFVSDIQREAEDYFKQDIAALLSNLAEKGLKKFIAGFIEDTLEKELDKLNENDD